MLKLEWVSLKEAECWRVHITVGLWLTDKTGPSSLFKRQTHTHRHAHGHILHSNVLAPSPLWAKVSQVVWKLSELPFCWERSICTEYLYQQQRALENTARKHNKVLILAGGVDSHSQEMNVQANAWRESRFVTLGCHIYCFLCNVQLWPQLSVTSVMLWFVVVSAWKKKEYETWGTSLTKAVGVNTTSRKQIKAQVVSGEVESFVSV